MKNILKSVVLFEGKATEKLKSLLPKDFEVIMASNMPQAFDAAVAAAQKIKARGDINPAVDMTMQSGQSVRPSVILLSPGATSFGIFKNEYDRGDQFREAFKNLAH